LDSRETKIQCLFLRFAYDVFIRLELSKDPMYFVLAVGVLNLMRWMMCAANSLAAALPRRNGMSGMGFRGTQRFQ